MAGGAAPAPAGRTAFAPVAGLLFNAFVWGVSWWPLRWLQQHGLHPLWATALIYLLAVGVIGAWIGGLGGLALLFLASNLALQYGAARLSANVTAVVMVSEVLFASVSAVALGAGVLTWPLVAGGALIVGAALLAVLRP